MKRIILLIPFSIFFFSIAMSQGFTISGTQLLDANGKNFVIRGISLPLAWFGNNINDNIDTIRKTTNANCLRIVVQTNSSDYLWQQCVTNCIANNMIPMVELHDVTCGTTSEGLANMAKWWISKKSFLTKPEIARCILINIANEWGDWNMAKNSPSSWKTAYINAVDIMRKGGITTTLVIDAPNCGQDLNVGSTIKTYAKDVLNSDSLKNCLFSIHMYGEWCAKGGSNPSKINTITDAGIPIIVGEFADQSDQGNLNELSLMKTCVDNEIGYMAWSIKGNNDSIIDMCYNWEATRLAPWGNTVINTENGLKNTSKRASVFAGDSGCIPTNIVPYIQINGGNSNQTAIADVNAGDAVVISPHPASGGSWIWYGPNGFSANTREITLKSIQPKQAGYYNVTYINTDSCISDTAIKISVSSCEASDTLISGATYKILSKFTGKSLDVENSSTDDGALVKMMPAVDNAKNQEWTISYIGTGNWKLLSVNSNKALNIVKGSIYGGAFIEQMKDTGAMTMKWVFTKDAQGYYQIKNYKTNLCLDIKEIADTDGAQIIQGTCITENNQKFSLVKLKDPDPVISIKNTKTNNISIYPNPVEGGEICISIDNNADRSLLKIFDLQGKLMYSSTLTENVSKINTNLVSGHYLVNICNSNISFNQSLVIK